MYAVEDSTFRQARDLVTALAGELRDQESAGSAHAVDLQALVRRSAGTAVEEGGEAAHLSSLAADLGRLFSIDEMFPRRRRGRDR